MTQHNPFTEPRFPNIPPFSLMPGDPPEETEAPESEESSPFPEPPDDPDPNDKTGGGN